MVLVQRRRRHHTLFAFALLLVSCGGSPEVRVNVTTPEGASAMSGVTHVEFSVVQGASRIAFVSEHYTPGVVLSFDKLPHESDLELDLVGRDDNGSPLVYGSTTTGKVDAGTCCVTLCLCSAARQQTNDCNCGTNTCDPCEGINQ